MSQRPPATYYKVYNSTADFPAGPAALTGIASLGQNLHLRGIYFEAGADTKNFVSTPSKFPTGTDPATVTQVISAPCFLEIVPESIDPSTTAFPFELHYGPLGPAAR